MYFQFLENSDLVLVSCSLKYINMINIEGQNPYTPDWKWMFDKNSDVESAQQSEYSGVMNSIQLYKLWVVPCQYGF